MRCLWITSLACLALLGQTGCGDSNATAPGATAAGQQSAMPSDPIAQVVFQFLDAVRSGQGDGAASQWLTPLALERITERNLNISPPGSPTARFQLGNVQMLEAERAVVESVWTDVDADGKPYQEPICCALRLCDGQWRIYGMAEDLGPGEGPVVIDFENLEALAPSKPQQPGGSNPTGAPSGTPPQQIAQDPFQPERR
jgi:hypothetical protein